MHREHFPKQIHKKPLNSTEMAVLEVLKMKSEGSGSCTSPLEDTNIEWLIEHKVFYYVFLGHISNKILCLGFCMLHYTVIGKDHMPVCDFTVFLPWKNHKV